MRLRWLGLLLALGGCSKNPPGSSLPALSSPALGVPPEEGSKKIPPRAEPEAPPPAEPQGEPAPPRGPSLEALEAEARKELGERVSFERVRGRYLLVSAPGWGKAGGKESAAFVERVLTALLNGRFSRDISRPLPVYLFGDAGSYNRYCRERYGEDCISIYGFFSHTDHRLVMNVGLGIGTLSHELVHPIVAVDFPEAPAWINEGIASLFEAPVMPKHGEIHGAKNWRYPRLSAAIHSPRERSKVTLPALFALTDRIFRGQDEALHYAMARYFCQWMDGRGQLWTFYQGWRDHHRKDPHGEAAFRSATGLSLEEGSVAWLRWVKRL